MNIVHDAAGREIWGFSKKSACAQKLEVMMDTLTGTLEYANQFVAVGTMVGEGGIGALTRATLSKTQVNPKLIPGVDGKAEVYQLVPGRLHLVTHVNAPVAEGRPESDARRPPHRKIPIHDPVTTISARLIATDIAMAAWSAMTSSTERDVAEAAE